MKFYKKSVEPNSCFDNPCTINSEHLYHIHGDVHTCDVLHRARWMAKLILSMKIYLFRSQFVLSDDELSGLKSFINFVLVVYIKNLYEVPNSMKTKGYFEIFDN